MKCILLGKDSGVYALLNWGQALTESRGQF